MSANSLSRKDFFSHLPLKIEDENIFHKDSQSESKPTGTTALTTRTCILLCQWVLPKHASTHAVPETLPQRAGDVVPFLR